MSDILLLFSLNICLHNELLFCHYLTDTSNFMAQCPENNRFKEMGLSVQVLEVTQQVLVEAENIGGDILELYFENVGGRVESVAVKEVDQSAIITFKEQTGMIL